MNCRASWALSAQLLLLLVASCGVPRGKTPEGSNSKERTSGEDAIAVRAAFEDYRSALLKQDGNAAAELVSINTIAMFRRYRDLAIRGNEKTVKGLSMINRIQVLLIRHRIPLDELKRLDGRGIFAYAVDRSWIGKESVIQMSLGDISVSGPRAIARLKTKDRATTESFHFVKEGGAWKFDLAPTLKRADQAFQLMARQRKMTENEFVFSIITTLSGRKVTDSIWLPLE